MTAAKSVGVIVEIVKKEFYQIRQDKRMMTVSILAPIMQVLLLGYAATTDIKNSDIVVCDLDRTEESRTFVKEFTNSNYFVEKYTVALPGEAATEVISTADPSPLPRDWSSSINETMLASGTK